MILLEIIAYFFVDLLFEGLIMGIVRFFRKLGQLFAGKNRTEKQPKRK
ncbi:hypothetical protein [Flavilitoribacter nigricans]|nr:hypothetical protein [Flavilitoribacter nigricans]